jgi:hypothetical protein
MKDTSFIVVVLANRFTVHDLWKYFTLLLLNKSVHPMALQPKSGLGLIL